MIVFLPDMLVKRYLIGLICLHPLDKTTSLSVHIPLSLPERIKCSQLIRQLIHLIGPLHLKFSHRHYRWLDEIVVYLVISVLDYLMMVPKSIISIFIHWFLCLHVCQMLWPLTVKVILLESIILIDLPLNVRHVLLTQLYISRMVLLLPQRINVWLKLCLQRIFLIRPESITLPLHLQCFVLT